MAKLEYSSLHLNREDRSQLFRSQLSIHQWVERKNDVWKLDVSDFAVENGELTSHTGVHRQLKPNAAAVVRHAVENGAETIIITDEVKPHPELPIYNPYTDELATMDEFREGFEIPSVEYLMDRAYQQVAQYPQYKPDMLEGWAVGVAKRDFATKSGIAIYKGDVTLFTEFEPGYLQFWSFENEMATVATARLLKKVTPSPSAKAGFGPR